MKLIPYGIEDFERLISENYYYIDHSQYIDYLERRASFILLLRPRRMGKSLFSNMMMAYYDMAKRDQFQELFGNLWIGKNPTQWANKFVTLKLDFSKVPEWSFRDLPKQFRDYCELELSKTLPRYGNLFSTEECNNILKASTASGMISLFVGYCKIKNVKSYLFIDEYDNFSNVVLTSHGVKAHGEITHGEGFFRQFFKACKGTFDRIYMTGIAPVTYDDLTSGFNIATVISLEPKYNHILGISETELRTMIEYYRDHGAIEMDTEAIVRDMKPWYDNFCFSEISYGKEAPIYNPAMVMNYMNHLIANGIPPTEKIDYNARVDYKKLNYLVKADDLDNREARFDILREICSKGYTDGSVKRQFPAEEVGDFDNFKSMLFYFGALTFGKRDDWGRRKLVITNKTMADLYLNYMLSHVYELSQTKNEEIKRLKNAIAEAAMTGEWRPMIDTSSEIFHRYSSVRNAIYGEPDAQGFLRGLLCLNDYFDIWPELELNQGFSDIMLIPKADTDCPTCHSYIIELKYMKSDDKNLEQAVTQAKKQLMQYVEDIHLSTSGLLQDTPCTLLYIIVQDRKFVKYEQIN